LEKTFKIIGSKRLTLPSPLLNPIPKLHVYTSFKSLQGWCWVCRDPACQMLLGLHPCTNFVMRIISRALFCIPHWFQLFHPSWREVSAFQAFSLG